MGQIGSGTAFATLLATALPAEGALLEGALWIGALVLGAVMATAGLVWVRRRLQSDGEAKRPSFTLEQLSRMHADGVLTAAEYRILRRQAAASFDATENGASSSWADSRFQQATAARR